MRLGIDRVARLGELAQQARGSLPASSGRWSRRATRSARVSTSASSQMAMQRSRISARVSLVHEGAAAGRDHLGRALDQPRDHPPLAVAEARLAEAVENLGDARGPRRARSPRRNRRRAGRAAAPAAARPSTCRRPSARRGRSDRSGGEAASAMAAGAIQGGGSWGKRPAMRRSHPRRAGVRRSLPKLLLAPAPPLRRRCWSGSASRDTEVPTQRIEQDVTNEALAG